MRFITTIVIFSFAFYTHSVLSSDDEGMFFNDGETSIAFSALCENYAKKVDAFEKSNYVRVQRAQPILCDLQTIIDKMNKTVCDIEEEILPRLEGQKGLDNLIVYTNNVLRDFVFKCYFDETLQFRSVLQAYVNIYDPLLNEEYIVGRHALIDIYVKQLNDYFYMKPDSEEQLMLAWGTQGDKEEYALTKTRMALQRFAVLRKAKHNKDIEQHCNSLLNVVRNGNGALCNYESSYRLTFNGDDVYYEEKSGCNIPSIESQNNVHDYLFAGAQQIFSDTPAAPALSYQ